MKETTTMTALVHPLKRRNSILAEVADVGASIAQALYNHMQSHDTAGHSWPDSAEFAVVHCESTWPCGWEQYSAVKFFDSRQELECWIEDKREWMQLEDNYAAWRVYEWDLGPQYRHELSHNEGNVRRTYRECHPMSSF